MNKAKEKKSVILSWIVMIALIGLSSLRLGRMIGDRISDYSGGQFLVIYLFFLVTLLISTVLQTAIHEAGHMVMGLLTGYRFVSYRIFSLMIFRNEEGKLALKRYGVPGTAGQCLMSPPDYREPFPFFLYNAGGALFNLLTSLLAFALMSLVNNDWLFIALGGFALAGICTGFGNGVPLKTAMAPNDGMNILEMIIHPSSRRAFWQQMKSNDLLLGGMRLKDMPDELFEADEEVFRNGSIGAYVHVLRENRCMDCLEFEKAYELIDKALSDYPLAGLHRCSMLMDKITIDCLNGHLEEVNDKQLENVMKTSRNVGAVVRCEYAQALYRKDEEKQRQLLDELEELKKHYPYQADMDSEMDIIKALQAKMK